MESNTPDYKIDKLDRQILAYLIEDARLPFTEIAKKLIVSPGTIHVRVKKMESAGIIKGASLKVDYEKLGYDFTAYVGAYVDQTSDAPSIMEKLKDIPEVTVAHVATGQFSIFCKIRSKDTSHAKQVIFQINAIEGILRTETMISLEESINDKERLFRKIFELSTGEKFSAI